MAEKLEILIIAGPHGAGKTTFAEEYLPNEAQIPPSLNHHAIAADLAPKAPEHATLSAGQLLLGQIDDAAAQRRRFAIETTLGEMTYARLIPVWRRDGYHVSLIFLSLTDPEICLRRVASRAAQGGLDVPHEKILRRYHTGLKNFHDLYREMVDSWTHYDNSGPRPKLLECGTEDD